MHTAVEAGCILSSCLASSLLLLLQVRKCRAAPHNAAYEHKFRALKYGRTLTYAVGLAATQVCDTSALARGPVSSHVLCRRVCVRAPNDRAVAAALHTPHTPHRPHCCWDT
jgi:hypothetical protein